MPKRVKKRRWREGMAETKSSLLDGFLTFDEDVEWVVPQSKPVTYFRINYPLSKKEHKLKEEDLNIGQNDPRCDKIKKRLKEKMKK